MRGLNLLIFHALATKTVCVRVGLILCIFQYFFQCFESCPKLFFNYIHELRATASNTYCTLEEWVAAYRGLYFGPKTIFIPPPLLKMIFFPSRDTSFFYSHCGLFALILPYFAFILPFYFPFSHFLSTFFLFLLQFNPFSLRLFIFLPSNFPILRPLPAYLIACWCTLHTPPDLSYPYEKTVPRYRVSLPRTW